MKYWIGSFYRKRVGNISSTTKWCWTSFSVHSIVSSNIFGSPALVKKFLVKWIWLENFVKACIFTPSRTHLLGIPSFSFCAGVQMFLTYRKSKLIAKPQNVLVYCRSLFSLYWLFSLQESFKLRDGTRFSLALLLKWSTTPLEHWHTKEEINSYNMPYCERVITYLESNDILVCQQKSFKIYEKIVILKNSLIV